MSIADNLWEEREDGGVHHLHGLGPLDVDEGIVEQVTFMSIHLIWKAKINNLSTHLLNRAIMIKVHLLGDGDTLPMELLGEIQDMLQEFQSLFAKPAHANSQKERQADFEIITYGKGNTLFCWPYQIYPREAVELWRQIDKAIQCGWIQPSRSNFGWPVLFMPKPDFTLCMCIEYCTVNTITIKDRYPLPPIEDLLNYMHGSCWFTRLDSAARYNQTRIATADMQKMAFTTNFGLSEWWVLPFGVGNIPRQFMHMKNGILKPMKRKFIIWYLDDIRIHSHTLPEHVVHVHEVLTLLMELGLKAEHVKCAWACQKVDFVTVMLTRTASTPRNLSHMQSWIGFNLKMVRTSEASWVSPVTIEYLLNITVTLQCHCTTLAPLRREEEPLGGDMESWGMSTALHLPGIENASMPSTHSPKLSALLHSWLYQTPTQNIACTSMLASMHWA